MLIFKQYLSTDRYFYISLYNLKKNVKNELKVYPTANSNQY